MTYSLRITSAAWRDLVEIHDWIAENDSLESADSVLDRLSETAESIAAMPHRGARPPELPQNMEGEFRQVLFKPYRVIYEVSRDEVLIHLIADGRRNLQPLLLRRLSGG
ncbi:MAG: type II toxin-antitoxin system RelE/ParE family toxin [Terracidiphilus sp.]|nr:type II toxin-antitoxin system RelE/ParE family toxin [Terracidiphilus sp.]